MAKAAGYILEWTGSYWPLFIMAGSVYGVALVVIHALAPKLEPPNLQMGPAVEVRAG